MGRACVQRMPRGFSASPDSPSWFNKGEAEMLLSVAFDLRDRHGVLFSDIAIISPYRKQVGKISDLLREKLNLSKKCDIPIHVSTVEAFQGRESRVVLLSCVRNLCVENVKSDHAFSIGFLKQPLRANVALSRAKSLMVIAGNAALMSRCCPTWRRYLERFLELPSPSMWDMNTGLQMQSIPNMELVAQREIEMIDAVTSAQEERPFERVVA